MSKSYTSVVILGVMIVLLLINALYSCRENFVEGLEPMDNSSNGTPPPELAGMVSKATGMISDASGSLPTSNPALASALASVSSGAAASAGVTPAATEGFDNIFNDHYSSATHWNNTNSDFFKNVPFKPQCCENSPISNSSGCACLSPEKIHFLHRHGNND
jgi:hypothetical protein